MPKCGTKYLGILKDSINVCGNEAEKSVVLGITEESASLAYMCKKCTNFFMKKTDLEIVSIRDIVGAQVQDFAFEAIAEERRKQDQKWGRQDHTPERWLMILQGEIGEWFQAVLQEESFENILTELVKIAAVAECMLEQMLDNYDGAPRE